MSTNPFMELVQIHERTWGMDSYPDRPSLTDMLSRPIVVFWASSGNDQKNSERRSIATVHNDLEELNMVLLSMLLASKTTIQGNRRIQRIFVHQKPVQIMGLKLILAEKE